MNSSNIFSSSTIAVGATHTVALDNKGQVWTFGAGKNGLLGHGNDEFLTVPKMVKGLPLVMLPYMEWSPETNHLFPKEFREKVFTLLLANKLIGKGQSNIPAHLKIPRPILYLILKMATTR